MIACRLSSVVLGVAVSLASTACQAAVPPCEENQSGPSVVHEKASPRVVLRETDDSLIRIRLLMADAVQKDLDVTADQMAKIREFVKFSADQMRELAAYWPGLSASVTRELPEPRKRELQAWIENGQSRQKELITRIVGMLTPGQCKRLRQIQLQHAMALALLQPSLVKALDISEEQLDRIRKYARAIALADSELIKGLDIPKEELERVRLRSDLIAERGAAELHAFDGLTPEGTLKKMIERTKKRYKALAEANRLALEALTPEQRVKLKKFVGKEVKVTWDYDSLVPDDGD